jgi:hypothetical protein
MMWKSCPWTTSILAQDCLGAGHVHGQGMGSSNMSFRVIIGVLCSSAFVRCMQYFFVL